MFLISISRFMRPGRSSSPVPEPPAGGCAAALESVWLPAAREKKKAVASAIRMSAMVSGRSSTPSTSLS